MEAPHYHLSMVSLKDLSLVLAALLVLLGAVLVGLPLYVHMEVAETTGAFAPLYLYKYSPYDTIAVEVHYQQGAAPSDTALDGLARTLENSTGKRVDVAAYGDLPANVVTGRIGDENVSAIGGAIIEKYARSSMGWISGRIPMYILYVNAEGPAIKNEDDTVVGISYRADSFIVLKNHIDGEGLEKSVLIHEAGHLFGLDHDGDRRCVMAAVILQRKAWHEDPPAEFCDIHKKELEGRQDDLFYNARFFNTSFYAK